MILLVDNGSAYSDALASLLSSLGCELERVGPEGIDAGSLARYSAFILSGRGRPNRASNVANARVIGAARRAGAPLLGICYGAEILAQSLGGSLRRMASPRRGLRTVSVGRENDLCSGTLAAYESHSYEIARLPRGVGALASSAECEFEVIRVEGTQMYGTQFHPEMSSDGAALLGAFVRRAVRAPSGIK